MALNGNKFDANCTFHCCCKYFWGVDKSMGQERQRRDFPFLSNLLEESFFIDRGGGTAVLHIIANKLSVP